ncbi:MAG TPA: hypothetical protein VK878_06965, partial [Candidatus Deferrimicrobiaceae bacterium]|nr:hypothetical protein [Candidatus Deferrimicrobiaceae bacterium]
MRGPIGLLLALTLGGCASVGDLLAPSPVMAPPRAAAPGEEDSTAAAARPAPVVREPVPAPAPPRPARRWRADS